MLRFSVLDAFLKFSSRMVGSVGEIQSVFSSGFFGLRSLKQAERKNPTAIKVAMLRSEMKCIILKQMYAIYAGLKILMESRSPGCECGSADLFLASQKFTKVLQ